MFLPHRYHHRLLLPPGWVALGFLLLLGCLIVRAQWRRVRLENMMPLTMLALHIKKSVPWNNGVYQLPKLLENMRPWCKIEFSGKMLADFVNATATEVAIRRMISDSSHAGGVRIQFLSSATYRNLVTVLDIMNYTNQKKYWLDMQHQLITLYAITNKELPREHRIPYFSDAVLGCCTCGPYTSLPTDEPSWVTKLESLRQWAWQPSIFMFTLIATLSFLRLSKNIK